MYTSSRRTWTALAFFVLANTGVAGAEPVAQEKITFDLAHPHQFSEFGVQIWPSSNNYEAIRDQVMHDLNVRFVRLGFAMPVSPDVLKPGTPATKILDAARARKTADSTTASLTSLAVELKKLGIKVHSVVWETPPVWRLDKHWRDSKGNDQVGKAADPSHLNDYANYVASYVLYTISLGFDVSYVEIINEPDGAWGTKWLPQQYAQLVDATRSALDQNGLQNVGIEGPGTGSQRGAPEYLAALAETGAAGHLAAVSVHDWDSRITAQPDPLGLTEDFLGRFSAMHGKLPLYITEFNEDSPKWSSAPREGPSKRVGGSNSADTPEYGAAVAAFALKLIAQGAAKISLWQIQDLGWAPNSLGLVDLQGKIRPAVPALQTFLGFISGPAKVVRGVASDPDLITAAFVGPDQVVIVASNASSSPKMAELPLTGLSSSGQISAQRAFPDGGENPMRASIKNGQLSLNLPAGSIAAVALKP